MSFGSKSSSSYYLKGTLFFLVCWAFLVYWLASAPADNEDGEIMKRINGALNLVEDCKQRNTELRQIIDNLMR